VLSCDMFPYNEDSRVSGKLSLDLEIYSFLFLCRCIAMEKEESGKNIVEAGSTYTNT